MFPVYTRFYLFTFSLPHRFTFVKVLPGNFDITAAHPSWTLEKVSLFHSVFLGLSR